MKVTGQIEQIFSQAVALDQSGGLRNTIYAEGREIYILNYDHTVLMRFKLRKNETTFGQSICFRANDYDSREFWEKDGKVIFKTEAEGFQRTKTTGRAEYSPEEVRELFNSYVLQPARMTDSVTLSKGILELFDDSLSHIEFSGKKGEKMKMIQRNIYSGGVIEIQQKDEGSFFDNNLKTNFGPIGIKTSDFFSLFSFQNILDFQFPVTGSGDYILVKSADKLKRDMTVLVSGCLYDEIIKIKEAK